MRKWPDDYVNKVICGDCLEVMKEMPDECVDMVITDLAVVEVTPRGLVLQEVAPGWTAAEIQALTEPQLIISPDLKEIEL